MCKIPKVVIVADPAKHLDLRRALSSLEYEVVATLPPGQAVSMIADVVVVDEPTQGAVDAVRSSADGEPKVVSVGGAGGGDLHLEPDDIRSFKTRIWELFHARPG